MKENQKSSEARSEKRIGDTVIRVTKRRKRKRLRVIPNIPGVIRFFGDIVQDTPFVPLLSVIIVLFLISSLVIYLAEQHVNSQFNTYGHTLWWSFTAMQTQGANSPGPITPLGITVGTIWSLVGTIYFFGMIIATFYAYYVDPKRRPSQAIIDALQYNLEEIDELSLDELEALKNTVTNVVNSRIEKIGKNSQDR